MLLCTIYLKLTKKQCIKHTHRYQYFSIGQPFSLNTGENWSIFLPENVLTKKKNENKVNIIA